MKIPRRLALMAIVCTGLLSAHPTLAQFSQQGPKLVGTGATVPLADQGWSVSLSSDGDTAIVGGPFDNSAWVWTRSGGAWIQQGGKLVGTGAVGSAFQGGAVSLSSDGNTAIVGGLGDNSGAGAAWVWTRSGSVWTQQGPKLVGSGATGNANQGKSVSLSADGNTAIIGGYVDNGFLGAAWIWTRNGGVWTQEGTKLVGSGSLGIDRQGYSVSISADGSTAIVGGPLDSGGRGAVWIWTRSGGVWTQQGTKLAGADASSNAGQGSSVSLSADGNTALVGGPNDKAAWAWTRNGGIWTQQGNRLVVTGSAQGDSVSLSADGNTAIIGGVNNDAVAVGNCSCVTGAAFAWRRSAGVWAQLGTKLVGSDGVGASQGWSVFVSGDGKTAIVGGPIDSGEVGAAWIFVDASAIPANNALTCVMLLIAIALLALFRLR